MNPSRVTNLEISKKLKALGVPQRSEYYWLKERWSGISKELSDQKFFLYKFDEWEDSQKPNARLNFSAYLTDELLEWLPFGYAVSLHGDGGYVCYDSTLTSDPSHKISDTPPNTLGLILIHLLEKGIIKVEDLQEAKNEEIV